MHVKKGTSCLGMCLFFETYESKKYKIKRGAARFFHILYLVSHRKISICEFLHSPAR